jgi:hypothetical protein
VQPNKRRELDVGVKTGDMVFEDFACQEREQTVVSLTVVIRLQGRRLPEAYWRHILRPILGDLEIYPEIRLEELGMQS